MSNKEIIINELDAAKAIRERTIDCKKELDIIENGLQELADTIDGLELKCASRDYWRDLVRKQDQLLDILKKCPFVLDSIYRNTNNTEFSKRYQFGTITDSELEIVKRWLEL